MSHNDKRRNREKRSEPPSLADIVRQETDNGRTIVRFYLDVASGKLDDEGFEVCHRMEAAEQVHAIAPGLVSEYIAQLTGVECSHAIRRRRTRPTIRRSRDDGNPSPDADCAKTARRHEALEYLASALAAPSLAADPRVAGIVHESTDHGKTVVSFLLHVMHGVVRGFRPRQRVQAACELLGHIAHDELARSGSVSVTVIPAESLPRTRYGAGTQGGRDGDGSPSSRKRRQDVSPSPQPSPAPAAIESSSPSSRGPIPGPSPTETDDPRTSDPAKSSSPPGESSSPSSRGPIPGLSPVETDDPPTTVIPADGAGIQNGGDTDDADDTNDQRGLYDIDRKIAEAQHDPSHPVHKFVQAYDEVAAAFHGKDKENDDDEEVRYWISGEVPDAYGKYIWEYAPAYPRSIRRKLRPKRRRSREPGTTPKAESVWMKRPTDKMREAGIPRPNRFKVWV